MKNSLWLEDVLVCVDCDKKNCKHWISVKLVRDIEAIDEDEGVCGAQFISFKNGRCAMFKYRDEHILPRGQKVLI